MQKISFYVCDLSSHEILPSKMASLHLLRYTFIYSLLVCISITNVTSLAPGRFWDGLRTTFPHYAPVPRTTKEALSQGWTLASTNCNNGGKFNGFRYIHKPNASFTESSIVPLYDVNGVIAGIQANFLASEAKADPTNTYKFDEIPMFMRNTIDGKNVYTLTSYFVDPAIICTKGRYMTDLNSDGTATTVSFQHGPNPSRTIKAPLERSVAISAGWSNSACFPGMGFHDWYQQEKFQDTKCDKMHPVYLLYGKDNKLVGFGWMAVGNFNSPRYEHHKGAVFKMVIGPSVSPCLVEKADTVGVTITHVMLISNPDSQDCK
ncbi:uncharacterized protein LOC110852818 [Folsomia candida]|uniref:Uncharacterized protein n=1 Tax=Folsomia candida TaxID=158441 RepID=A0A226F4Q4_FOLCA|nr:uncharacterized protein LOC110852818 [Folsomia candida]OXA64171.1 hypothetical protein Fcan01_00619 [Folsomia candida]